MLLEFGEIELCLRGEGQVHIAVKVKRQQTAAVVWAERNFTAWVGGDCAETLVGVAVGNGFPLDGVPEKHSRFSGRPCVVYDFLPKSTGINLLAHQRVLGVNRVLLHVGFPAAHAFHEFVVYLDRNVGSRHFALDHFCVDELLRIRMLYGNAQHQGTTTAALGHFAGGVRVAFHEGYDACGGESAVVHKAPLRTDVREVVADAAAPLHKLYLFLINLHDCAVGVGGAVVTDDKAV